MHSEVIDVLDFEEGELLGVWICDEWRCGENAVVAVIPPYKTISAADMDEAIVGGRHKGKK